MGVLGILEGRVGLGMGKYYSSCWNFTLWASMASIAGKLAGRELKR